MKTHFEKALDYVRNEVDMMYVNYIVSKSMEMRCTPSLVDPLFADDVADLLEEYGQDNDLGEGWWANECDIDEIIEML